MICCNLEKILFIPQFPSVLIYLLPVIHFSFVSIIIVTTNLRRDCSDGNASIFFVLRLNSRFNLSNTFIVLILLWFDSPNAL